jgi:GT2 family glycosyltransferase
LTVAATRNANSNLAAIVVTYQSEPHLEGCLASLLPQIESVGGTTVIWDNASTDDSAQRARSLAPSAIHIVAGANLGFAAAVNAAANGVDGRDLLLVNPDSVLDPGAVTALIEAQASDRRIGVLGATLSGDDRTERPAAWKYPAPRSTVLGAAVGLGRAYRPTFVLRQGVEIVTDGFVPFTVALLRRSAFDQAHGLDEAFWLYGEDADYCYRVSRSGWSIGVVPGAHARHVGGGSGGGLAEARSQLAAGDRFRRKHFGRAAASGAGSALLAGAVLRLGMRRAASSVRWDLGQRWTEWAEVRRFYRRGGLDS